MKGGKHKRRRGSGGAVASLIWEKSVSFGSFSERAIRLSGSISDCSPDLFDF